mmetsp:Transcript_29603/g.61778  ORF Transcript_29603/g.61778 Transcript_29603/m.61778 type:complete len:83 (-) Transcript_29603:823-1071(-)
MYFHYLSDSISLSLRLRHCRGSIHQSTCVTVRYIVTTESRPKDPMKKRERTGRSFSSDKFDNKKLTILRHDQKLNTANRKPT